MLELLLTLSLLSQGSATRDAEPTRVPRTTPNILLILMDDVGMDMIGGTYQEVPDAPATPNFDRLATDGLFFRNAWANPFCSPTRATLLTGRYSFRHGIGTWIHGAYDSWGLPVSETTLPERLRPAGYTSAAYGKWHLGVSAGQGPGQGALHPLNSGFDFYRGAMENPLSEPIDYTAPNVPPICAGPYGYFNWFVNDAGDQYCTQRYMTTDTVDDCVDFLQDPPEPWFLYVPFHAIHEPFHDPTGLLPPTASDRDRAKAMMEVLDAEIGRLLAAVDYPRSDLYVFLLGDNGTPGSAAHGAPGGTGCFGEWRSKGTVYEGGVNVPLVIVGPGVVPRATDVMVNSTDVFATICQLAGVPQYAEDATSLRSVMLGSDQPVRDFVYAEAFGPNGLPFAPTHHSRAVSDGRYKLIRTTGTGWNIEELYDLANDPCEEVDLLPVPQGSPGELAYLALVARLVELGVN